MSRTSTQTMARSARITAAESRNVFVFAEIQDHERLYEGARELLSKARQLADTLSEKLYAVVLALEAEKYLPDVELYGPDAIIYCSHNNLKHYQGDIFPEILEGIVRGHRPSILLFPATEAGRDLSARLTQRLHTGLTAHCTDLDIIDSDEHGKGLLLMKRPAFSGNMIASILCPEHRPQIATVQSGVFEKRECLPPRGTERIRIEFDFDMSRIRERNLEAPRRWDRPHIPLEKARVIVAGGRGMGSCQNFKKLFVLSDLLGGEVGATRVPVFNEWCPAERMIGQTGRTVKPRLYLGFGVSGQIQHTTSIVDSDIIVSVNLDRKAPIGQLSDYVIEEDAPKFAARLVEKLQKCKPRK